MENWSTRTSGTDADCVPVLRFLGVNLERADAVRSEELNLPVGSILLNHIEYIIEVLLKFEPSLQLKTRATPGNQESFATRPYVERLHCHLRLRSHKICSSSQPPLWQYSHLAGELRFMQSTLLHKWIWQSGLVC